MFLLFTYFCTPILEMLCKIRLRMTNKHFLSIQQLLQNNNLSIVKISKQKNCEGRDKKNLSFCYLALHDSYKK